MMTIPSLLYDKLNQSLQTAGNNAQPKIEIIAQKASKYIAQGTFLRPRTIRTGTSLECIDVCVRREDKNLEPSEIVMIYIENGFAKVATLPYVNLPDQNFKYRYTIGQASDVACEFDGRWFRITDHTGLYFESSTRWSLVTFGEPYLSFITNGKLYIQRGNDPSTSFLLSEGVSKCVMIRGWKSTSEVLTDQGLICAYIKNDGLVYYRNYCEQSDGTFIWEIEKHISNFTAVNNLGIFRTNDYRVGFLVDSNNNMSWVISSRSYSGMAVDPENISVNLASPIVKITPVNYVEVDPRSRDNVNSTLSEVAIDFAPASYDYSDIIITAQIITDSKIKLTSNYPFENIYGNQSLFSIYGGLYPITSMQYGDNECEIVLTTSVTMNMFGNLNVSYRYNYNGIKVRITGYTHPRLRPFTIDVVGYPPNSNERISGNMIDPKVTITKVNYKENISDSKISSNPTDPVITVTKVGSSPI